MVILLGIGTYQLFLKKYTTTITRQEKINLKIEQSKNKMNNYFKTDLIQFRTERSTYRTQIQTDLEMVMKTLKTL